MRETSKQKRSHLILMISISIILIIAFVIGTYAVLNDLALRMVITYTDELAEHDMNTIKTFITDRWNMLNAVYTRFTFDEYTDLDTVISDLHKESSSRDEFDCLCILDSQGNLYSDTGKFYPANDNPILKYFKVKEDLFVEKYYGTGSSVQEGNEYMLYGIKFTNDPIVIKDEDSDLIIVGMAVMNDISKIRERLKITCFNERGFASIIDHDGTYIVPDSYYDWSEDSLNFFDILSQRKLEGITLEELKKKMNSGDIIPGFWCTDKDGVRRLVSVYTLNERDWSFVISLDESIFTDQIINYIIVVICIVTVLLFIISLILFVSYRMRSRLRNMYASVAAGIYNRQYYEDKITGAHVNALAIMDLDYLKSINDSFGHVAGDRAIKCVAETIRDCVGKKGVVCRFGGDEFIVAFTDNLSDREFAIILEDIRAKVNASTFGDYPELRISMSIGGYYAEGITKDLVDPADKLLYKAKKSRNFAITNVPPPPQDEN